MATARLARASEDHPSIVREAERSGAWAGGKPTISERKREETMALKFFNRKDSKKAERKVRNDAKKLSKSDKSFVMNSSE